MSLIPDLPILPAAEPGDLLVLAADGQVLTAVMGENGEHTAWEPLDPADVPPLS